MPQSTDSNSRPTSPVSTDQLRDIIVANDTVIDLKMLKNTTPFRDAGADSLDFFNLILAIQEAYGITIPDDDLSQVNTLEKLACYINEKLS
jgi:acyl carrier protein